MPLKHHWTIDRGLQPACRVGDIIDDQVTLGSGRPAMPPLIDGPSAISRQQVSRQRQTAIPRPQYAVKKHDLPAAGIALMTRVMKPGLARLRIVLTPHK